MIVVVTEARVRGWSQLPTFLRHAVRSMRQALADPACHGARVRLRGPLVWCTVTGWTEEAALQRYVRSGAHLEAMRATRRVTTHTRFARLVWPGAFSALSWREARAALDRPVVPALVDTARRPPHRPVESP